MSHYTSSGSAEEIESTWGQDPSARSSDSFSSGPTYSDGSSLLNSFGSSTNCSLQRNVRFVNSAAFIERIKDINVSDFEESSNPKYLQEAPPIPSLDLRSLNGSSRSCSSTYRKSFAKRVDLEPNEAYQNWLSAKRKLQSEKVAQQKREEQQKLKMLQERKRLAEEKYQQWLESKSAHTISKSSIATSSSVQSKSSTKARSINLEEARMKVHEWEYKKACEEQRRRDVNRLEEQRCRHMSKERRIMAEACWQHWSAGAANKPKPVPLNRGLFSLKGTVSDIFINPNEWQDINAGDSKK